MNVLGIDISKRKFDVALLQDEVCQTATFSNEPIGFVKLRKWLKKHRAGQLYACLEATGRYGDGLALFLHEAGCQVSVVNPAAFRLMQPVSSDATRRTKRMQNS